MLVLPYARESFIDAFYFFSVDTPVMAGWHYRSSYTCFLIPYTVHCSAKPPHNGARSQNLYGWYVEAVLGVH